MSSILEFIGGIVIAILVALLGAVIAQDYISWFIAPIFKIPTLSFRQVFGLLACFSFLSVYVNPMESNKEHTVEDTIRKTLAKGISLLVIWGIGYIYYLIIY